MTEEAIVNITGLTRKFGNLVAVDNVDLQVPQGCIYGFLGPNGSGKSTTMRMLTGLLKPTSGTIIVMGLKIPEQADSLRGKVGYMTQKFSLYDDLSAAENLDFVARIYGVDNPRQRIKEVMSQFRLVDNANQRTGTLSGGQRQRVALAAAVLHRPALLVLDEPTSAVDPESRRAFWEHLFDLTETGVTVLVSTHLMDEAERCHRIAILNEGKKVADAEPDYLLAKLRGRVLVVTGEHSRSLRPRLLNMPEVKAIAQIGKQLRILLQENQATPDIQASIQQQISKTNPAFSVAPGEPNLEDVFVDVTWHLNPEKSEAANA